MMGSIDTHSLVVSKENIQPLRHGRDTSQLSVALQAETDSETHQALEKQRNEFEIRLRIQQTEDPLAAWCDYIHWIEQSFPRQPREGKLNVVLQKCLNKFKDNQQYMNDIRFVKLCLKYADLEDNTVELLSQIHHHGIGATCAEFYVAWAEKYAINNCFKQANHVYDKGAKANAQPFQLLEEARGNFHRFLVRKISNEKEKFQPTLDTNVNPSQNSKDKRQAYNVLQPVSDGHKEVIPSVRVGENVAGLPGKLRLQSQKDQKPKSNTGIKIYQDSENDPLLSEPSVKIGKIHSKKVITKENTQKAGVWTNKSKKNVPFAVNPAPIVKFEVHRDEIAEADAPRPLPVTSSALKSHKSKKGYEDENFATAPLFYAEPYDPSKKPMYCKDLVYAGGLEFQFEELRAIRYQQKYKYKEDKLNSSTEKDSQFEDSERVPESACKTKNSSPEFTTKSEAKNKSEKKKGKSSNIPVERKSTAFGGEPKKKASTSRPAVEEPSKAPFITEDVIPTTDYSINQTINTKEALSEMQQLWFSKPASPLLNVNTGDKQVGKSILKTSKPQFNLYVDESCLGNLKKGTGENLLNLTAKAENNSDLNTLEEQQLKLNSKPTHSGVGRKLTYQIYNDKDNENPKSIEPYRDQEEESRGTSENKKCKPIENFEIMRKSTKLNLAEEDDENKENDIPGGYSGPLGKSTRKTTGILTPAANIPTSPLGDEESEEEEEEDEEQEDFSVLIPCNTTAITETCNFTKAFQCPRSESTPNPRKSILSKTERQQFNDSMFSSDLEEKKPQPPKKVAEDLSENGSAIENKKPSPRKEDYYVKNLSVIAETSREYKSSSSGSGASTFGLRSSKNFPYTPSEARTKYSLTASHLVLQKTKGQSLTGYEASTEFSHNTLAVDRIQYEADEGNEVEKLATSTNDFNEASAQIEKLKIVEEEDIDPFRDDLINKLLQIANFPNQNHLKGYFECKENLPAPRVGSSMVLGDDTYDIKKVLGEGSYAKVFRISNTANSEVMVAKFQKPSFPWEFYITREVQSRIKEKNLELASSFMNVDRAYFFENASVLLTKPVEYGDLLSAINKMKQSQNICQLVSMYFVVQILEILETLHASHIIHADIKPDNFLIRNVNKKPILQLIDFGRSIDMSLLPEGTTFNRVVTTEGFTCIEMQTGKRWTYQIDLYGAANCGHCLLFGDYMKVAQKNGSWNITKLIPRYWARREWNLFFLTLLNVESCSQMPDLSKLRALFSENLAEDQELELSLFTLVNLLNNR